MEDLQMVCVALVIIVAALCMKTTVRRKRRRWERPHLGPKNREIYSQASFLQHVMLNDSELFFKYLRFTPDQFKKIEQHIGPSLVHHCFSRATINPSTRLEITLRYLVSGETQRSLALNYRLGDATVHKIIHETVRAIPNILKKVVMPSPDPVTLKKTADDFWSRWNFPHCCGSCDGKRVRIKKPLGSGSEHYNYKGNSSCAS